MLAEFGLVVCHALLIIFKTFIGHLLFFWPKKYKDISSDVVLITGGGKGIGRLIAVEFAKRKPRQVGQKTVLAGGTKCSFVRCIAPLDFHFRTLYSL
jgi:hypothetical protein